MERETPLPNPLLHKCVEEREIAEICKKLRCARSPFLVPKAVDRQGGRGHDGAYEISTND
jgi:hypothetical protein